MMPRGTGIKAQCAVTQGSYEDPTRMRPAEVSECCLETRLDLCVGIKMVKCNFFLSSCVRIIVWFTVFGSVLKGSAVAI